MCNNPCVNNEQKYLYKSVSMAILVSVVTYYKTSRKKIWLSDNKGGWVSTDTNRNSKTPSKRERKRKTKWKISGVGARSVTNWNAVILSIFFFFFI